MYKDNDQFYEHSSHTTLQITSTSGRQTRRRSGGCDRWPACNQPPRPTQPPTGCGTGNKYQPKCDDALRLGIKDGMAHSIRR